MNKVLPISLLFVLPFACKKDQTSIDKSCAKIIAIDIDDDGGKEESGYLPYVEFCGGSLKDLLASYKEEDMRAGIDYEIYYKGQERPEATYLIIDNCQGLKFAWIRYDNNVVPKSTIKYWQDKGMCTTIKKMRFAGDDME